VVSRWEGLGAARAGGGDLSSVGRSGTAHHTPLDRREDEGR
jgi:hypothetical protein